MIDRDHGTGVIVWDAQTGKTLSTITNTANGGTHAVVFSPNKKRIAISSRQFDKENDRSTTTVSVAYALTGITEWQQNIPGWAVPKAFTPDGKYLAVLRGGHSIRFINVETGTVKHEIKSADYLSSTPRQGAEWNDFAISSSGTRLAIGGVDKARNGSIEIWDISSL